jgi:signal transduction histidine kinase
MHKTLERQLKRICDSLDGVPPEWSQLLEVVSKSYTDFDNEYKLIERSLDISSSELTDLNRKLRSEVEVENKLNDRLKMETEIIEEQVQLRTQELAQEQIKLATVTRNMKTGAILIDSDHNVIFINDAARGFIGFSGLNKNDALKHLYKTFSEKSLESLILKSFSGDRAEINEIQVGYAIFKIYIEPIVENADLQGLLVWIDNITETKLLERAKSELIAVASHQLRTPLTVTKGNTEILLDESYGPLSIDQKDIVSQTHESNENMINLVNKMLDVNKIEQGNIGFTPKKIALKEILDNAVTDLTPHAEEKNVEIKYTAPENQLPQINGDEVRLYQVFQNLIDNAIKYCRKQDNKCLVSINLERNENNIVVTVQDQGIGIPQQEQGKIFERFYRASNAKSSYINGTGLGLNIVKSIVEECDGTISFTSEENKGSRFTLVFPVADSLIN